jgi:hypothetical protein
MHPPQLEYGEAGRQGVGVGGGAGRMSKLN